MSEDGRRSIDGLRENPTELPAELVDRLLRPFARFLRIEALAGAVLLSCALVAIALFNSPWGRHFAPIWEVTVGFQAGALDYARPLKEWINDALMTLFFFLVALELKRELVLGEINKPRAAALSIAGAVGGMVVPAALYLTLQAGHPTANGWGTVMATDTAFVMACLVLLGKRVPESLRVFMLSLAIVDDIGAILVLAFGYSNDIHWGALGVAALGFAAVRVMAIVGLRGFPAYFLAGSLIWVAVDASGVHATVTGVVLGLMTPARRWVSDDRLYSILGQVVAHPAADESSADTKDRNSLQVAEVAIRETLSPVERLEIALHPWVAFLVMPLFALANVGLPLSVADPSDSLVVAIFVALSIGKPIGVVAFTWFAVRSGLATRPPDLDWAHIAGGGMLAGIGFTMSLFIANLAYSDASIVSAKLGIFAASLVSAAMGLGWLVWHSVAGVHRSNSAQHGGDS